MQPRTQLGEMPTLPHVFESRFRVQRYELDGFPAPEIQTRGWGVYVVKLEVEFMKEAQLGDEQVVRTRVSKVGRTSMTFHQFAAAAGTPDVASAEAHVRSVWVGDPTGALRESLPR